ncbi:MAG: hypothetical protein IPL28_26680 [Chloroflexi bacterium]|nr:hypothetical protein [Chloroflexota bacterium]MDA0245376.1 hypothetical protein [Chloroflexota bacterium]
MNWSSLFIGLVLGGLLMWVVDWFFYGQLHDKGFARVQELQERAEVNQQQLEELHRRLETSETLRHTADGELVTARADAKEAQARVAYLERQLNTGQGTRDKGQGTND